MIKSVDIENFRCFESASADDLGLINLVVGDNAVGKTTLLEALYLLATNSPEAHAKLLRWRQVLPETLKSDRFASGDFWMDLFHWFEKDRRIRIKAEGAPNRSLEIFYRDDQKDVVGGEQQAPITFRWDIEGVEKPFDSVPSFKEGEVSFPSAPGGVIQGAFLTGAEATSLAQRFTSLDVEGRTGLVEDPICSNFSEIESLSAGVEPGGTPRLYAKLRGRTRKIPLGLISSGIHRLVYLLTTVAAYPGGCVFVEEFAKGVFHERLGTVWSVIQQVADEVHTQIYLTTHSGEAVEAAEPVIEEHEDQFRLVRVTRDRDAGRSSIKVSGGANLASAIRAHIEVR